MEFIAHGDLLAFCCDTGLPERDSKIITSQIVEGLQFLHDNAFTHRDLKPKVCRHIKRLPCIEG